MEIRHLRLVRTLAIEGTLTAAGKKLYLSQSALSHQLREIEDEFGVTLFRRIKKRMVLTTAGQRLLNSADIVLGEIDSARNDITHMNSGDTGTLRISACRHASLHWLPGVLKSLKNDYPGVDVCIDHSVDRDPTENLLAGTIDLAIVNAKTDHSRIVYLKLFDDQMVAVVSSDHPWASRRKGRCPAICRPASHQLRPAVRGGRVQQDDAGALKDRPEVPDQSPDDRCDH